jgi:hypothetical protein
VHGLGHYEESWSQPPAYLGSIENDVRPLHCHALHSQRATNSIAVIFIHVSKVTGWMAATQMPEWIPVGYALLLTIWAHDAHISKESIEGGPYVIQNY